MSNFSIAVCFFLFSVFIASVAQIMLKKSANKIHKNIAKEFLNPFVISAYMILLISVFLTMIAYKTVPLSFGMVLESTGYFYILVLGSIFLNEKITLKKLFGNTLIVIGILIFSLSN